MKLIEKFKTELKKKKERTRNEAAKLLSDVNMEKRIKTDEINRIKAKLQKLKKYLKKDKTEKN